MKKALFIICCFIIYSFSVAQTTPMCFRSVVTASASSNANYAYSSVTGDFNLDGIKDLASAGLNGISVFIGIGDGTFLPPVNYTYSPTVGDANCIITDDFNADGNLDLVVSIAGNDLIHIFYGSSTGVFGSGISHSSGFVTKPVCIVSGDFNGDGKPDIASANSQSSYISVWLNTSGTIGWKSIYYVGYQQKSITCADFNNDGKLDLATTNTSSGCVTILSGSGTGSFSLLSTYSVSINPYWSEAKDFNADGNSDLAVVDITNNMVLILTGDGLGNLATSGSYSIGSSPRNVKVGDFNNDGIFDLSTANYNSNDISVLIGLGAGLFAPSITYSVGYYPNSIATCDFNADGNLDLAVSHFSSNKVVVLIGSASGTFSVNVVNSVGENQNNLANYDFNADGIDDLAITDYLNNNLTILAGSGTGSFSTLGTYSVGSRPTSLVTGDFNGDGKADIATANNNSNSVSVLLGSTVSGSFFSAVDYSVGLTPFSIICNDFNSDSFLDLAVVNYGSNDVSILLGTGLGSFLPPTSYYVGVGPTNLLCRDFNLDGKFDLAVSNFISGNLSILFGDGLGHFAYPINYIYGFGLISISSGDYNEDGFEDLIASSRISSVKLFLGSSTGTFSPGTLFAFGNDVNSLISDDFNGDGKLDMAYVSYGQNLVRVVSGNGTSSLLVEVKDYAKGLGMFSIISGDINGDGKKDIVGTSNNALLGISLLNDIPPIVSIIGSNIICQGSSVSYTALGASTYTWSNGTISNSLTVSPTITRTYSAIGTNSIGCISSNTAVISVTVNPLPTISVNSGTICSGESFTMNPSGALSYTFSSGSSTVSPISNTIYTVIGSSIDGCIGTSSSTVAVNISPTITVNSGTICIGDSFTMNPSGAYTYTYSTGSSIVSPTVNTTYSVVGASSLGCAGTNTAVSNVLVNSTPSITVLGTNSVCIGTSNSYTASGATSYTWSTGATTPSVAVSPTVSTSYSVIGIDALGCSNTETISLVVDNTCADVWPGDANSDGVADNLDVLELGLHYAQTGPARAITSNLWQSYFSNNWIGTITGGKNVNHSDCNGDGIIDANDTLAIYNNYGLTHAFRPELTTLTDPQLSIVSDQGYVEKGKWGSSSIYLGDATAPVNTVNGVAFTLNFDNTLIETDSIYLTYLPSFIDAGNNLLFRKRDFVNNKLYTTTTHTNNINVSGYGKIAIINYKIKSSLMLDVPLNFSISQGVLSNASGSIVPLTTGTSSVLAVGASVGIKSYDNSGKIIIYPNPAKDVLYFETNALKENMSIVVYNAFGQIVLKESIHSTKSKLAINSLANGVYFIDVLTNETSISKTKFVKE